MIVLPRVQKNDIENAKNDEATPDNNGMIPNVSVFKTLSDKLNPKEKTEINNTKLIKL